jgi:hypothetical protein
MREGLWKIPEMPAINTQFLGLKTQMIGVSPRDQASGHRFVGRPPFLPHCDSFFLYLWVVAFPPFLPMHRGQINFVRGCNRQYVSLATAYFYLKMPLQSQMPAFFFLGRPAYPTPTSALCT